MLSDLGGMWCYRIISTGKKKKARGRKTIKCLTSLGASSISSLKSLVFMTAFIKSWLKALLFVEKGEVGKGKGKHTDPGARCWFEESKEGIIAFDVKE